MEIGESLEETARYEAFEETGLELDQSGSACFSGQELVYACPNGDIVVNVLAVYTARQSQGELIECRYRRLKHLQSREVAGQDAQEN